MKDDTVVRVGNDNEGADDFGPGEIYQMRSCVRGRTSAGGPSPQAVRAQIASARAFLQREAAAGGLEG